MREQILWKDPNLLRCEDPRYRQPVHIACADVIEKSNCDCDISDAFSRDIDCELNDWNDISIGSQEDKNKCKDLAISGCKFETLQKIIRKSYYSTSPSV